MIASVKLAAAGLLVAAFAIGGAAIGGGGAGRATVEGPAVRPKPDFERLQGNWVRVSTDGQKVREVVRMAVVPDPLRPVDPAAGAPALWFEWEPDRAGSRNRVLIDPAREPKALTFFPPGDVAPKGCPGIYKLDGDTLTICFRPAEGERPGDFAVGKPGRTVDVYERAKP